MSDGTFVGAFGNCEVDGDSTGGSVGGSVGDTVGAEDGWKVEPGAISSQVPVDGEK